jgi:hypothetical protein
LTGAAITPLANPLTFIAAGAAVGFWYFFPTEKGKAPAAMSGMKLYVLGNTKQKKICFCLWQRIFDTLFLMKIIQNAESPFSDETMKAIQKQ